MWHAWRGLPPGAAAGAVEALRGGGAVEALRGGRRSGGVALRPAAAQVSCGAGAAKASPGNVPLTGPVERPRE
ncbi:hypothetical protein [Rhizomonospora bruguierae]|uniref:hypothetical protein n=1 Tax=Rhizomonospora bruguierae TaxID=1581705 RepID=UPI001BCB4229|nr:hypothetical protein [Micromonospora sp. NBRC 107566]